VLKFFRRTLRTNTLSEVRKVWKHLEVFLIKYEGDASAEVTWDDMDWWQKGKELWVQAGPS